MMCRVGHRGVTSVPVPPTAAEVRGALRGHSGDPLPGRGAGDDAWLGAAPPPLSPGLTCVTLGVHGGWWVTVVRGGAVRRGCQRRGCARAAREPCGTKRPCQHPQPPPCPVPPRESPQHQTGGAERRQPDPALHTPAPEHPLVGCGPGERGTLKTGAGGQRGRGEHRGDAGGRQRYTRLCRKRGGHERGAQEGR